MIFRFDIWVGIWDYKGNLFYKIIHTPSPSREGECLVVQTIVSLIIEL
jgi:hypothetical protein